MNPIIPVISNILLSLILIIIIIPYVKKIGIKYKLYDPINSRKQHKTPTLRLGGLGIFLTFMMMMIFNIIFFNKYFFLTISKTTLFIFLISSLVIFAIGFVDDLIQINPLKRLFLQFIVVSVIFYSGLGISSLNFELFNQSLILNLPSILGLIITFLWISGIINAINWIDGLDGLASGTASIISLSFGIRNLLDTNISLSLICFIIFGVTIGFLKFNSYISEINMGDSGSNFLGFSLAFICLLSNNPNLQNYNDLSLNILYGYLSFLIPITDMIKVIYLRMSANKSPFYPDRLHFHYQLVDNFFSYKKTVSIVHFLTFLGCFSSFII